MAKNAESNKKQVKTDGKTVGVYASPLTPIHSPLNVHWITYSSSRWENNGANAAPKSMFDFD